MRLFLSRKPEVALTNLPQGSVPRNNAILSRYLCLLSISRIPLVHIAVALRSSGTVTLRGSYQVASAKIILNNKLFGSCL